MATRHPAARGHGEQGQVTPLLALVIVVVTAVAWGVGQVGLQAAAAARGQAAADAAALAGAAEGVSGARALAAANGADLVAFVDVAGGAQVTVGLDGVRAQARAEYDGPAGSAGGDRNGLQPAMLAALARAEELLGQPVPVTSGFRSFADQQRLWANRHANPYPVARPGTSRHESGLAVDVPSTFVPRLLAVAAQAGLCRPLPLTDPIHFELCRWTPAS